MYHATQVHNVTRGEKRSSVKKATMFDCAMARYREVKLYDFVYKHHCFPDGWDDFKDLEAVKKEIATISSHLFSLVRKRNRKGEFMFYIEPPMNTMFKAFEVERNDVKVVIIGQDPVPEAGKATGLAFSLKPGTNPRDSVPTVFNMLVELKLEGMNNHLSSGDLSPWVGRGVLLLNAALTVTQGTSLSNAGSHQKYWKTFTQLLVKHISDNNLPTAWILWGDDAKKLAGNINKTKHFIKAGGHPSPQGGSAGIRFFGRNYFSCANEFLESHPVGTPRGRVDWSLPPQVLPGTQPGDCDEDGLWA